MLSKFQKKNINSISSTSLLEVLQEACQLFEEEREQWKKERLKLLERLEIENKRIEVLLAVVKVTKNGDMEVYQAGHWAQV